MFSVNFIKPSADNESGLGCKPKGERKREERETERRSKPVYVYYSFSRLFTHIF